MPHYQFLQYKCTGNLFIGILIVNCSLQQMRDNQPCLNIVHMKAQHCNNCVNCNKVPHQFYTYSRVDGQSLAPGTIVMPQYLILVEESLFFDNGDAPVCHRCNCGSVYNCVPSLKLGLTLCTIVLLSLLFKCKW